MEDAAKWVGSRLRPVSLLIHSGPVTWDEVQTWPDNGHRYECFAGVLTMTPGPAVRHQMAVANLLDLLRGAAPPDLLVLPSPLDWWISQTEWYEPDVIVFRRSDYNPDGPLRATPVLVVEVTSPSTRLIDLNAKRAAYAANSCPFYWTMDPAEESLVALRLAGEQYEEVAHVAGDERFEMAEPFPVAFTPGELGAG